MNSAHKLQDEWLLSYAAGNLSHGRSLVVASHLAYHDDIRETVASAEALGGVLLDSMDTASVSDNVLDEVLSRLEVETETILKTVDVPPRSQVLPQPLLEYTGRDVDALNWRFMGPGMSSARLWDGPNDERLWLLKARGGVMVPEHGHSGEEWTLILKGSYHTSAGHFGVGDIDVAGEETVHQPIIDADEECICLVMTEGPIRLKSIIARMVQPIIGL
jgi:putative transcriptional regulator